MNAEQARLAAASDRSQNWKRWGPYLSERQWGTVREDYSADSDSWRYFTFDQARSRVYRWGEDGLLGICDRECRLCFALALWNARDPILKERLFGLTGPEGNHGEDVKESYFYLDSTPTHSYLRALYKYPQAEFPYAHLLQENRRRNRLDPEFELADTGVFDENRYWDVQAEYAKNSPDDLLIRVTISNRGPDAATLHVLPTLWYRNTWVHGCTHEGCEIKPRMSLTGPNEVLAQHVSLGAFHWLAGPAPGGKTPPLLFTDNESNLDRLWHVPNPDPFVKDAFHDYLIEGQTAAVNPKQTGTKAAAHYQLSLPPGGQAVLKLRLVSASDRTKAIDFGDSFDAIFAQRIREADEFYAALIPHPPASPEAQVARQAYAGLGWTKQFYHYVVKDWLEGDSAQPRPPEARRSGRNSDWPHLFNRDVLSMPDKWEYPWFAAWDLAFHMIPFARIDPEFAKEQLLLLLREWYMHPSGQIPAYEFNFSDVNPPVHAWACWRVYKMTGRRGARDRAFLKRAFTKLLLNFTWWVNRKDLTGKHLFAGGFLGLDNIGVFDRSKPLPGGGSLQQADGTAWMAFFCATMLSMALELAEEAPEYEDIASKFFEHFVHIADAMNTLGGAGLWDETDGFYYDQLQLDGRSIPLRVRSMVGVIPLFAAEVLEDRKIVRLKGFKKRMEWFLKYRADLAEQITYCDAHTGEGNGHRLLAIPSRERLERTLRYVLDEQEFLSPFGLRSMSRRLADTPYAFTVDGQEHRVDYVPGESNTGLFGGNSNWRGPIWLPVNYLLIEALERYHHFYGDALRVECPTGSSRMLTLQEVARELSARLVRLFLPDVHGRRPIHGDEERYASDEHFQKLILFYEYFHGDTGRGCGASHQTGWTALVARLLEAK